MSSTATGAETMWMQSLAVEAARFCLDYCDHKTRIHHPDCLSQLWDSLGRLVVDHDTAREMAAAVGGQVVKA